MYTKAILFSLLLFTFSIQTYGQATVPAPDNSPVSPFQLIVTKTDFTVAYSYQYVITQDSLKLVYLTTIADSKDSTVLAMALAPSDTLRQLAGLQFDKLESYYMNPCIKDGLQLGIMLQKGKVAKFVTVSNYYLEELAPAIALINNRVPANFKIWYDKKVLEAALQKCKH